MGRSPESVLFLGELSLDGGLRHTIAILPMVVVAREEGIKSVFLPEQEAHEVRQASGVRPVRLRDGHRSRRCVSRLHLVVSRPNRVHPERAIRDIEVRRLDPCVIAVPRLHERFQRAGYQ